MTLVNKKITADELAQRLVNSKKVMHKVDTDTYKRGNINEDLIIDATEPQFNENPLLPQNENITGTPIKAKQTMNADRINQSKLPDAIKQAMIEHPIPQITLEDNLDMNIAARAKKLMEKEGLTNKPSGTSTPSKVSLNASDLERTLTPIIENIIRKTLDSIVETKLNQILMAQQTASLNENLVIKVGDSIFGGKITKVKSSK